MEKPNQQFKTSNALLAYCLYLAGVPFANPNKPCMVFYSEKIIQKFVNGSGEPIYRGWKLDEAVEDAWKKRKLRGHIEYVFKITPALSKLLRAYGDQIKELETGTGFAADVIVGIAESLAKGEVTPDVALLRQACVILKMRIPFMEAWEYTEPIVLVPKPGEVKRYKGMINTKHGMREALITDHPGFIGVGLYSSKELKEELKVL